MAKSGGANFLTTRISIAKIKILWSTHGCYNIQIHFIITIYCVCLYVVPSMEPQNVNITTILSRSFMLSWDPPLIGEQNGILIRYHVIIIQTQIHYTDDGEEIMGMQRYLNRTYNVSEGCTQLIDEMIHPDYNYTVRIAAATEPGIGPFSDPITVRTSMDGECI